MDQKTFHNLYTKVGEESGIDLTKLERGISDYDICRILALKYHFDMFDKFMSEEDLAQEIYTEVILYNKNRKINDKQVSRTLQLEDRLRFIYNKYEQQNYDKDPEEIYYIDNLTFIKEIKNGMEKIFQTLNPRERRIIELRYGFDNGKEKSLDEVAKQYSLEHNYYPGITRERVRQLESKALRKLRHKSRSEKLKEFKISLETGNGEL